AEDPFYRPKFRQLRLPVLNSGLTGGGTALALTVAQRIVSKFHFRPQSFLQRHLSLRETTLRAPAADYWPGRGHESVCLCFGRSCPASLFAAPIMPDEAANQIAPSDGQIGNFVLHSLFLNKEGFERPLAPRTRPHSYPVGQS